MAENGQRILTNDASALLDGVNVAAVALMAGVLVQLGQNALREYVSAHYEHAVRIRQQYQKLPKGLLVLKAEPVIIPAPIGVPKRAVHAAITPDYE